MTYSTHFIYGKGPLLSERENFLLSLHGLYSFQLATRGLLYVSSHIQDITYHSLCYSSCGALAGTRNSSMGPP